MHRGFLRALVGALLLSTVPVGNASADGLLSKLRRSPQTSSAPAYTSSPSADMQWSRSGGLQPVARPSRGTQPVREAAVIQVTAQSSAGAPASQQSLPADTVQPAIFDGVAAVPLGDSLRLEQLEQLALTNNPAIAQLSAAASQATGIRNQVGRYPNPTVGYSGQQLADNGTDQHMGFVEQQIVLGNKLALNENVLNQEINARLWEVETQRRRVLTDVHVRFYEALTAQRQIQLTNEFKQVAQQGVDTAKIRVESQLAPKSEQLQSQIQLSETEIAQRQAEFLMRGAWQELAAIAGMPQLQQTRLDGELRPAEIDRNWDDAYLTLLASSPELCRAHAQVRRTQANIARQQAQPIPNLDVMFQAGHDRSTGSGMINVQVGAPIPVFNQNRGNIEAAYADYCRATQEVRRVEMSLKARLARTAQEFDSAAVAVKNYETNILPQAKETLDLTSSAYAAGEFDFLQVLVARRTYFDSNLRYLQALGELAKSNARIEGLLLTGGLDQPGESSMDDGLRGQSLDGK